MSEIILIADKSGKAVGGVRVNHKPGALQTNTRSLLADRLSLGNYGTQFGGDRDYYEILGYPHQADVDDYLARFDRDPLGGRIVEFPPEETWRDTPTIKDGSDKEAKETTRFCKAWTKFAERMRVYHYCQRVDTLAGIGRFGILLIGVAGNGDLSSEVKSVPSTDSVIYLRPYHEQSVMIKEFEDDPGNPRYGLPRIYTIAMSDIAGTGKRGTPKEVHWSRVIHVAEGLLENEVYGRPRLQRVINLLDDILKVVGGSAEATWLLIRKGLLLNVDKDATISPEDETAMQEQVDEYVHGLRRVLQTRGMTVTDLGSEVADPTGLFNVIIALVSIATRIPKRILMGSERGELASSQDASNWAGYIAARQLNFAEAVILRPLIDRLIKWGALPPPSSGRYACVWDALFELTDTEKATNAKLWAEAAQKAKEAVGYPVITGEEYRGEFTPFEATLPDELTKAREQAQQPVMPEQGKDVLDQVREVLVRHGLNGNEARAVLSVAAGLIEKGQR